jgi:hypothetical protein
MSQVIKKFIGNDQVDGTKIKLLNNQAIRARNAANSADVDVLKLDASDIIQMVGAVNASGNMTAANLSGTNSGDITLGAVGASPSANGASLSGQVLTLQPFDATHPGVVVASGGGTSNFLRADGTWASPSGSGANVTLSNLTSPTAINQDLIFDKASDAIIKTKDDTAATSALNLLSGDSSTAAAGAILIQVGNSDTAASQISINGGNSNTDVGGGIVLTAGTGASNSDGGVIIAQTASATGTGNSGYVQLRSGQVVDGISGALLLSTGTATGTGSRGLMDVDAPALRILGDGSAPQALRLMTGNNANYTEFKAGSSMSGSVSYELPNADGNPGEILSTNGSGVLSWSAAVASATNLKELFTLSGTDITNQYIDLTQVALTDSIDFVVKGGGIQIEGASYDYSVSYTGGAGGKTRITFLNDLATGGLAALIAGDVVVVKYQY